MSFSIQELAQIDELIEHARFHKAEHGDNFFVFLSKHYGEQKAEHDKTHHEEKEDHEQLPFNCQHQLLSSIVFIIQKRSFINDGHEIEIKEKSQFFYLSPVSNYFKKGILQPPQLT